MGTCNMATSIARRIFNRSFNVLLVNKLNKPAVFKHKFSTSRLLASRFYTEKHEWIALDGGVGTVGISNHAQEQLGEIVYVELPEVGAELEAEDMAGCLESVKAASEIYSPVAGEVSEVNEVLVDKPGLVNSSPVQDGWLFKLKVSGDVSTEGLMDEKAYQDYVGALEE